MPELPEVETVRRGLNQVTLAQEIQGGDVLLDRTIARPLSVDEFLAGLKGSAIAQWHRRGKYLLAELTKQTQPAGWLGVHLRMTGQLLWLDTQAPLQKHTRVRLFLGDAKELRFVDQRTFGQMWWVPAEMQPEAVITGLQKLGLDPFSDDFSVNYLAQQLRQRRRPIKTALLDQALVAGIGNIYADEALFLSGIRSITLCSDLKLEQIKRLRTAIIQVLQASIEAGGTTFSNFLNVQGVNGNYGGVAWVYNRATQPCRVCGTSIQRLKLAGRSTHFCPQCQS
ncbi:MAG TPA: DNA-formamidopyrimidine glycosylase [Candidatus Obscuribacterales bacterium]